MRVSLNPVAAETMNEGICNWGNILEQLILLLL